MNDGRRDRVLGSGRIEHGLPLTGLGTGWVELRTAPNRVFLEAAARGDHERRMVSHRGGEERPQGGGPPWA